MKFKRIILITLLLLSVLTISSVSASQNNATDEVLELENRQNIDNLSAEPNNDLLGHPVTNEDDCRLQAQISNDSSGLSAISINESDILSVPAKNSQDNIVLKSAKKIYGTKTISFALSSYPRSKTLKTWDTLYSGYSTNPKGQLGRGLHLHILNDGLSGYPLNTKVIKAKFYYKNKKTGAYKVKTYTKIKNDKICIHIKSPIIKGYKPVKAKIWYTSR